MLQVAWSTATGQEAAFVLLVFMGALVLACRAPGWEMGC